MDHRFALIAERMRPKGCVCLWAAGREYWHWGGGHLPTLIMTEINDKCPVHVWLESQSYPVATDS